MKSLSDYTPSNGDILSGPFAKDHSSHCSVILRVVDNDVYMFPISSKEKTYERLSAVDAGGLVVLSEEERQEIYGERKDKKDMSFIYCGEANLITHNIFSIQALVYNGDATYVRKASQDLIDRMAMSVYNSSTMTPRHKKTILGLTHI